MTDDNPFETSTLAAVADMSPEERVFGPAPLPVFEPPSVMDPVSNLDFLPVDDAFALEMRSETIEQLVGGDALRRGVSERIEAGRSHTNADLVAGRDRVRVHGTLHEHTGHGLAEQAAHLHVTVDGTLDIHAASEDTVLLAGHMRDLWDGGAAIVAAMTDDTVAGGGIRVTTPLDLWVHGLMGVEERIGTCTTDAVLMESGATHYEREYGPGVHAAGLAVYTGSLYQSSRSSFRPLMRVSSGVRNLIAAGGDGGGGGDAGAGSAPATSPAPPPAAGGAGTQAASETLCAATGAGGTMQAGVMAEVRSEDLTGIHRVDDVEALALGTNVPGACVDPTGPRRGEDTAGQLEALRDAMRGTEAGAQHEVTSVSRVPKLDDTDSLPASGAPDFVGDIHSGARVPGMDTPVSQSAVSPPQPPPGVMPGFLGGSGDPVRPAPSAFERWQINYTRLRSEYEWHRQDSNWIATPAFRDAISKINRGLIETYVEFGGSIDALKRENWDETVAEQAYRAIQDFAREADGAGDFDRASGFEEILASIDRLTVDFIDELGARADEFDRAYVEARRISSLDPRIDAQKVTDWIEGQIRALTRGQGAGPSPDLATSVRERREITFLKKARHSISKGRDPRVDSYFRIRYNAEIGSVGLLDGEKPLQARLLEAMADPSMHRPVVPGSEAGGAIPPPLRTEDSGAAGRLGDIPRVSGPSSPATAGTDAGDLGRGMLDQSVVGPADEAHPGTAAPRSGDAQAMATPELGAQATFWLHPVDPVPAPGTVRFDAGLQRAGQQPQHSGEAAFGGTAVHRPFVPTPEDMLDPSDLTYMPSWSADAFEVERDLMAGRLPPGFDSFRSTLLSQWHGLASDTEIESSFNSGLLPTRAIDSMTEQLRAVEGGRGHIQQIQQLEAMKKSLDRVLTDVYGSRADADWLDKVDKFLKFGSAAQAVGVEPVSVPSRGEDIVGGARTSLQPARVESAAPPRPAEWGAGELSPGALSPEEDPWGPPWSRDGSDAGELSPRELSPVEDPWAPPWPEDGSSAGELSPRALSPVDNPLSPRPRVRFDATQPVNSLGAGGRGIAVGPTGGWQAAEAPGFGRPASISAELPLWRRVQIVHRVAAGEALSPEQLSELIRRYERTIRGATIASPAPRARTAAALLEDLRLLSTAARVSPASALLSPALEDIDWAAIELMLRLLDAPGL